jgi:hypothetical protein
VGTPTLTCNAVVGLALLNINARVGGVATAFTDVPAAPVIAGLPLFQSHSWTVDSAAQSLDFQYSALLGIVTVTVQAPTVVPWAPVSSPWLVNNQWERVATYAISHGHKITGPGACNVANPCISLGGAADKEAIVMMAGRPVAGQARAVPALVADYLEGADNTTPDDMVLERNLRTTAFNDQPVVVRP